MLAKTADEPFTDNEWVFEIKWDGYRAIADNRDGIQLYSRNGLLYTEGFSHIYTDLQNQEHELVLDGELVAYNEDGLPSFQALQRIDKENVPVVYQVFDLLWLNGHSTEDLSLLERKELLKEALVETDSIRFHDHVEDTGKEFFQLIVERELEGIIAKKKSSKYREGRRSGHWLKIKNTHRAEVTICGYTAPRGERKYFGSLIVGQYVEDQWQFRGHVGTGFTDDTLKELYETMQKYKQSGCPFPSVPATNDESTWLRPELLIEIKFTEQTNDGIFRHGVYLGLRSASLVNDEKSGKPELISVNNEHLPYTISNPEKVFWPDSGITKRELAEYYQRIQEFILPHLANRPQSMNRFPDGIEGMNFYQKNAPDFALDEVATTRIYSEHSDREISYILCNDAKTMAFMNNLGCIDFNSWASPVFHLDAPDYLMLDLDPSEENTFAHVVQVARAVKDVLDVAGIPGFCKTSGSTGIHVFVPLGGKYSFDQTRDFAHLLMQQVHDLLPGITTLERKLKARPKQAVYLDYLQNRRGQTLASVYSVRPKPKAPVSTPLQWNELDEQMLPTDFTIRNVESRFQNKGDLFRGVFHEGINMLKAIENLETGF